jgi:hypothetical protein
MRFRIPEIVLGFLLGAASFSLIAATQLLPTTPTSIVNAAQGNTVACLTRLLGVCFVTPAPRPQQPVFGFAQFLTVFALLMVAYTLSDARYRFRLAVAPIPLIKLTFILSGFIGVTTLLTSIWFVEQWPVPSFFTSQAITQGVLGLLFFALALIWIWLAFIRPPKFGRRNCKKFAQELYWRLLQGVDSELPTIASELGRSAESIVHWAPEVVRGRARSANARIAEPSNFAHDILLLIGMRKFCRHIIASAPGTAMTFFNEMSKQKKYHIPIGQFASNISIEALLNKDSILYHEDEGFYSGYFGYVRPFTRAIYGDFDLIEALTRGNSPLDIPFNVRWNFDADQLAAYTRALLTTFEAALEAGRFYGGRSAALYRAFDIVEHSCHDLYKLNEVPENPASDDIRRRLNVVVSFINDAIDLLEKQGVQRTRLRRHDEPYMWRVDFYDDIANLMFEVIKCAASVKTRDSEGWSIQHNAVWTRFFSHHENKTRSIVLFKLRRLLYEEVRSIERFPNFANAALLGYCLNVMGLRVGKKRDHTAAGECQLRTAVISWARRNYLWMVKRSPKAANAVLIGTISFDAENKRLVKTYVEGLRSEPPRDYLPLEEPTLAIPATEED